MNSTTSARKSVFWHSWAVFSPPVNVWQHENCGNLIPAESSSVYFSTSKTIWSILLIIWIMFFLKKVKIILSCTDRGIVAVMWYQLVEYCADWSFPGDCQCDTSLSWGWEALETAGCTGNRTARCFPIQGCALMTGDVRRMKLPAGGKTPLYNFSHPQSTKHRSEEEHQALQRNRPVLEQLWRNKLWISLLDKVVCISSKLKIHELCLLTSMKICSCYIWTLSSFLPSSWMWV